MKIHIRTPLLVTHSHPLFPSWVPRSSLFLLVDVPRRGEVISALNVPKSFAGIPFLPSAFLLPLNAEASNLKPIVKLIVGLSGKRVI